MQEVTSTSRLHLKSIPWRYLVGEANLTMGPIGDTIITVGFPETCGVPPKSDQLLKVLVWTQDCLYPEKRRYWKVRYTYKISLEKKLETTDRITFRITTHYKAGCHPAWVKRLDNHTKPSGPLWSLLYPAGGITRCFRWLETDPLPGRGLSLTGMDRYNTTAPICTASFRDYSRNSYKWYSNYVCGPSRISNHFGAYGFHST